MQEVEASAKWLILSLMSGHQNSGTCIATPWQRNALGSSWTTASPLVRIFVAASHWTAIAAKEPLIERDFTVRFGRKAAVPHALHYDHFTRAPAPKVGGQRPPNFAQTPTNFIRIRLTLFTPLTVRAASYSTVTDFARLRGLSTSVPLTKAA